MLLYVLAAVRFYLLYRRRRSVMLLSLITASALLAESMVAVMLATSWQLTWWLWHLLMVLAFGYVGYSAYVTYQREGATTGLFDGIGTDQTVRAVRAEYGAALEALVSAVRRQEAGELSADEMALIIAGMESRFGLSEGQTAVLGRAAGALRSEREQIDRLGVLVAIGHESRVRLEEQVLLRRAVRRVAAGFGGDGGADRPVPGRPAALPGRADHRLDLGGAGRGGAPGRDAGWLPPGPKCARWSWARRCWPAR